MSEVGVFLGGEGRNELGSRSGHPVYQTDLEPGVIETLLRRLQKTGWKVVGARNWSQIRKLRAHGPAPNEQRNVAALLLDAKEAGAQILAFVRDSDGDQRRRRDIESAISVHESQPSNLDVVGGVAEPVLESWLLALQGASGLEQLSKVAVQRRFSEKNGFLKDTAQTARIAESGDLSHVPLDAPSLLMWLDKARKIFSQRCLSNSHSG